MPMSVARLGAASTTDGMPPSTVDYCVPFVSASGTDEASYKPVVLKLATGMHDVGIQRFAVKGYHYVASGKVFVEVRYLAAQFYKDTTVRWCMKTFMQRHKTSILVALQKARLKAADHLKPSLKKAVSSRASGSRSWTDPLVRQEWTMSLTAALAWLCYWGGSRRSLEDKRVARELAAALCHVVLGPCALSAQQVSDTLARAGRCEHAGEAQQGVCLRVLDSAAVHFPVGRAVTNIMMVSFIAALAVEGEECCATGAEVLEEFLASLGQAGILTTHACTHAPARTTLRPPTIP